MGTEHMDAAARQLHVDAGERRAWVGDWARREEAGVGDSDFDRLWESVGSACDSRNIVTSNRVRVSPARAVLLALVFYPSQMHTELDGVELARHVCVGQTRWTRAALDDAHEFIRTLDDKSIVEIRESITNTGDLRIEVKVSTPLSAHAKSRAAGYPDGLFIIEQPR